MLEKQIEKYLVQEVKNLGGVAYKFTSPQRRSVPDRLCVFRKDTIVFVECKATGKEPTDAQYREMAKLRELDCWVEWVDSKPMIRNLIRRIETVLSMP